jgi:hypothetical protein
LAAGFCKRGGLRGRRLKLKAYRASHMGMIPYTRLLVKQ